LPAIWRLSLRADAAIDAAFLRCRLPFVYADCHICDAPATLVLARAAALFHDDFYHATPPPPLRHVLRDAAVAATMRVCAIAVAAYDSAAAYALLFAIVIRNISILLITPLRASAMLMLIAAAILMLPYYMLPLMLTLALCYDFAMPLPLAYASA